MRGRLALGGYFFLHGAVSSSWLSAMTMFISRFASPDSLGAGIMVGLVVLLGVALAPLGMPLGAWLVGRWGARRVAVASAVAAGLVLGGSAFVGSLGVLALAMVGLALANGALLVAMNLLAAGVERESGRLFLPWCHGLLALGGLVGVLLAVQRISAHVPQIEQLLWTAAVSVALAVGLAKSLPDGEIEDIRPRMPQHFAMLAVLAFAAGVAADVVPRSASWRLEIAVGAISLRGEHALALGMAVGGLAGGLVAARIGVRNLLNASAGLTALGLVWLLLVGDTAASLGGFLVTGLGLACVFPVALSLAAARGSARHAIAALSVIGYVGTLSGTQLTAWLSYLLDVRFQLAYVLVVPVVVVVAGTVLSRGSAPAPR
ncbi:MFS transporter [Lentzea sp. NEAU-D13]|uniref:MFS transporter n=1 Tax=Lentzea alba TaxID=2714351 RepID=A0A7C9S2P0_9PSEU|nr:MFS transporter [Lentzea alba]NGY66242.1 MFS transporter [Lentzea alba]